MALVNRKVLLLYDLPGASLWHERLILQHVSNEDYVVATPDLDVFVETISLSNEDLKGLRILPRSGAMPAGLRAGGQYIDCPPCKPLEWQQLVPSPLLLPRKGFRPGQALALTRRQLLVMPLPLQSLKTMAGLQRKLLVAASMGIMCLG